MKGHAHQSSKRLEIECSQRLVLLHPVLFAACPILAHFPAPLFRFLEPPFISILPFEAIALQNLSVPFLPFAAM